VERSVGQLILLSESEQDLTKVDLADGRVHMRNCQINAALVNQFTSNYGINLIGGSIGDVIISLQWSDLLNYWTTSSMDIENEEINHELILDQLTLNFQSPASEDALWHDALSVDSSEDLAALWTARAIATDLAEEQDEDEEKMIGFVDHFLSRLAVNIVNLRINFGSELSIALKGIRLSKYLSVNHVLERELTVQSMHAHSKHFKVIDIPQPISVHLPISSAHMHIKIHAVSAFVPDLEELSRIWDLITLMPMPKGKSRPWTVEMDRLIFKGMDVAIEMNQINLGYDFAGNLSEISLKLKDVDVLSLKDVVYRSGHIHAELLKSKATLDQLRVLNLRWQEVMAAFTIPTVDESFTLIREENNGLMVNLNFGHVEFELLDVKIEAKSVSLIADDEPRIEAASVHVCSQQNTLKFQQFSVRKSYNPAGTATTSFMANPKFPFSSRIRYLDNVEVYSISETDDELLKLAKSSNGCLVVSVLSADFDIRDLKHMSDLHNQLSPKGDRSTLPACVSLEHFTGSLIGKYRIELEHISLIHFADIFSFRASNVSLSREGINVLLNPVQSDLIFTRKGREAVVQVKGVESRVTLEIFELFQSDYFALKDVFDMSTEAAGCLLSLRIIDCSISLSTSQDEASLTACFGSVDYLSGESVLFLDDARLLTCKEAEKSVTERRKHGILLTHLKGEREEVLETGLLKIDLSSRRLYNHKSNATFTIETFSKVYSILARFAQTMTLRNLREQKMTISREPKVELLEQIDYEDEDLLYSTQAIWADETEQETSIEIATEMEPGPENVDGKVKILSHDLAASMQDAMKDQQQQQPDLDATIFGFDLSLNVRLNLDHNGNHVVLHMGRIEGNLCDSGRIRMIVKEYHMSNHVQASPWKTIVKRWPRGPDITNYSNFNALNAVNIDIEPFSEEYVMKVNCCPVRAYLDQVTLTHMLAFVEGVKRKLSSLQETLLDDEIKLLKQHDWFFRLVEISPIAVKLDYKPRKCDSVQNQGPIVMDWCELSGAEMVLPATKLQGVHGFDQLLKKQLITWLPHFQGQQLRNALMEGLVPVRTMVNLSSGLTQLILLPMQDVEERTDARVLLRGLKKGIATTGVEVLRLGASMAVKTQIVLERVDALMQQEGVDDANLDCPLAKSKYSNDPQSLSEGLINATNNLRATVRTIIAIPLEEKSKNGKDKLLKVLPVAVVHSAKGVAGVVQQTLMGIAAAIDPVGQADRLAKYQ